MSDLVKKLLEANGMSNQAAKESILRRKADEQEAYRMEMAGAVTRLVVNEALREARARNKVAEEVRDRADQA
jgi:hypothetical protein